MSEERLSSADASALAFDGSDSPMHLMAIVWLEAATAEALRCLALDEVRRTIAGRLDRSPRLRQVVRGRTGLFGRAVWAEAPAFDLAAHVTETVLPAPGSEAQLLELAAATFMEPLDRDRPLWELCVVGGLADGRHAFIVKLHHAIADGPAAVRLLSTLFDPSAGAATEALARPAPRRTTSLRRTTPLGTLRGYARAMGELGRAPVTSLNRPLTGGRRLAIVRLRLGEASRVAHANGATVNDVFLVLVAAGVSAILAARGESVAGNRIIASMFVGLRQQRAELGNETGILTVPLRLGQSDNARQLAEIAAATRAVKSDRPASAGVAVSYLMTRAGLGRALYRRQRQTNLFTTNVIGPGLPLRFAGARVVEMAAVTSLGGNVTLSFAMLSYADALTITVVGDAAGCPEVHLAAEAMRTAWLTLAQ